MWARGGKELEMQVSRRSTVKTEEAMAATVVHKLHVDT